MKSEKKLHREEVRWVYDPRAAASQLGDITVDIHMVTWGKSITQGLVFSLRYAET